MCQHTSLPWPRQNNGQAWFISVSHHPKHGRSARSRHELNSQIKNANKNNSMTQSVNAYNPRSHPPTPTKRIVLCVQTPAEPPIGPARTEQQTNRASGLRRRARFLFLFIFVNQGKREREKGNDWGAARSPSPAS
jgi:hypothetical protein